MKSLITSKVIFIYFFIYALLQPDLFPQKARLSNTPERKQMQQTDHEKNNDRKRIETGNEKEKNSGGRKDHNGITINRPEREKNIPKNPPEESQRKKRNNQDIIDETVDSAIDIDLVPIPFFIPIDQYIIQVPDQPKEPAVYKPPEKFNPASSGLRDLEELDFEGALYNFTLAITRDTGNYKLYFYRGVAYLNLKYYKESIEDFDTFLLFYFYDMDGYFQRGLAKFYLQQKLGAYADLSIAAEMGHKAAGSIIRRFY